MKQSSYSLIFIIIIMLSAFSCSPFQPEQRISPEGIIPAKFSLYSEFPEQQSIWWEDFNDPELNNIIKEILSENLSIRQAWSRLRQANMLLVQKGAASYPDLNFTVGSAYKKLKTTSEGTADATRVAAPGAGQDQTAGLTESHSRVESYSFGFSTSYELDLWGRIRSDQEASKLDAMATREDINTATITLAAQAAEIWVNIISQRIQKRLIEKQLETNKIYLDLVELRFRKGVVSALDVLQQQQVLAKLNSQLPLIELQEQKLLHSLALLMGKPPAYPIQISRKSLPEPGGIPSTGIPADLLERRPDIRAAGLRLRGDDYRVAVARANRLPALSLSATAEYSSNHLDLLLDNWILNLAGNLFAPIYDGGRLEAEERRTRAVVGESLLAYRETVLNAINEVEDALVTEIKQKEHIGALEKQLEVAQSALDEAIERYIKGLNEYLPVITQIVSVQGLEKDLIQMRTELVINRIGIYRKLGGTWMNKFAKDCESTVASVQQGDCINGKQ